MRGKIIISFFLLMLTLSVKAQRERFTELIWSDEFNYTGIPDTNKWNYDVGGHGWGNDELQYYTYRRPENARVEDGKLIIEARKEDYKGKRFTSTRLVTSGKAEWLYGRIEMNAKLPRGRGTWPAGWMLASDWTYGAWPESGEIDIMEHVGWDMGVNHISCHSLKYYWKSGTQKTAKIRVDKIDSTFHTYAIEWGPNRFNAYVDDSCYFTYFKEENADWPKWPFDKPFYLIMNIAIGGAWGSVQGIDESIYPQRLEVDYVRVYKYNADKDVTPPSAPQNLIANTSANHMNLLWDPGYDNYGVKEYKVFIDGKLTGTAKRHDIEINDLQPGKTYACKVIGVDWSGNESPAIEGAFTTKKSPVVNAPGKIESEDYISQKGVFVEKTSDTLAGLNVCWLEPGDELVYELNVTKAGEYKIDFRTATERVDAAIEIYNSKGTLLGTTPIVNTRSWQAWKTYTSPVVKLDAGVQKLKLKIINDRISLNWMEIK